ncbi:MAG TPA: ornithine carbamoyltransferase, partial [Acidimicrobiales bacterium]|nr:ornithine carbamoyltransferase [Acidimicrobiales bacterium]
AESAERLDAFAGYQVNAKLMAAAAPGAVFLHCLPAHRGQEVTPEVIDGPASVIFDQAENRMHAARGLLMWMLSGNGA